MELSCSRATRGHIRGLQDEDERPDQARVEAGRDPIRFPLRRSGGVLVDERQQRVLEKKSFENYINLHYERVNLCNARLFFEHT